MHLRPACTITSPFPSPPFPFSFLLSKPLTASSLVGAGHSPTAATLTPHPRHLTPKRNGFVQVTCLCLSVRLSFSQNPSWFWSRCLVLGQGFRSLPTPYPSSFVLEKGHFCHSIPLSPYTCYWPLGGACLSVRRHPGLSSFILASQGMQRGMTSSAILPLGGSSCPAPCLCSWSFFISEIFCLLSFLL